MMPIQFHQHLQEKACKIELKNKIHLFSKKEKGRNESIRKKRNPKKQGINKRRRGLLFLVAQKCLEKNAKSRMLYHQIECEMVDDLKLIEFPLYSRLIYFLIGVGEYEDKKK